MITYCGTLLCTLTIFMSRFYQCKIYIFKKKYILERKKTFVSVFIVMPLLLNLNKQHVRGKE